MGAVWFIFCQPQQILTVFIRNYLNATDMQLGNFIALLNLAGVFHLGAIVLYSYTKRIKCAWIIFSVIARSSAFFIAASAYYVYRGGSPQIALWIIIGSSFFLSFIMGNLSGSGWWTWITMLTPEKKRAAYFGKRSSLAQLVNIIFFFSATWLLDHFNKDVFLIYTLIYLTAGIFGVADILLHLAVPEPKNTHKKIPFNFKQFSSPVRDKNFLRFALITGFSVFSINIISPFQAPFITNDATIGAPNIWLGIMFLISQLTWVILAPFWGILMDRMGKKPVVLLGLLYPLSFILYLLLTPLNYSFILPLISLWTGFFAPAFWEGINQMMLLLTPEENRTPYIAWFWALMGMVAATGPLIGGFLMSATGSLGITTVVALCCLILSFLIFSTIKTPRDRSFEHVVAMITTPSTYRTFYQLPILSGRQKAEKVHKALRDVKHNTGELAFEEVYSRLDDPDQNVREEAVLAMGRIGTDEAGKALITHLDSIESLVRPEAAKALGLMGDSRAIPYLIDALYNGDEELQEESARALGKLYSEDSVSALRQLIREDRSERVKVTGAQSIALQGRLDALEEIIDLWEQTKNPVLQKQLSISLGNLIGKPGEFYLCITGTDEDKEKAMNQLFEDVHGGLKKMEILDFGFIHHILTNSLPSVEELFYEKNFRESFSYIFTIILNLISRRLEFSGIDPRKIDIPVLLKKQDSFLYLGFYLVHRFEHIKNKSDLSITGTEILLSLYYLKYYCKREKAGIKVKRKKIV